MRRSLCIALSTLILASYAQAEIIQIECAVTETEAFFGSSLEGEIAVSETKKGDIFLFEFSVSDGVVFATLYQEEIEHEARVRVSFSGKYTTLVVKPEIVYANDESGGNITLLNDSVSISSSWHRSDPTTSPQWPDMAWNLSLYYGNPAPSGHAILSDETRKRSKGSYLEKNSLICLDGFRDYRFIEEALWREFSTYK